MIESRKQLKEWFVRGAKPTEEQFHAWLDSYLHKDEYEVWNSAIQTKIDKFSKQVSNFLDVDDNTKDQLSEIIALIETNSDIADALANTISVNDIIDNLTSYISSKPLSARQGAVLKSLIDELDRRLNNENGDITTAFRELQGSLSSLDGRINGVIGSVDTLSKNFQKEKADNEDRFLVIGNNVGNIISSVSGIDKSLTQLGKLFNSTNESNERRFTTVEGKVTKIDTRLLTAENKLAEIEKNGGGGGLTINAIEKGDSGWNIDTKGRTYSTMNISADTEVAITTADSVASGYEHYLLLWNSGSESVDVAFGYKVGDVPTVIIGESSTVSIDAGGYVEVSVLKVPNYGLVMTMSSGLKGSN